MRYKRFSRVVWTFSIPKFWQFSTEREFFNSHACLHQLSVNSKVLGRILPSYCAVFAYPPRLQDGDVGGFPESEDLLTAAVPSAAAGRCSASRSAARTRTGLLRDRAWQCHALGNPFQANGTPHPCRRAPHRLRQANK